MIKISCFKKYENNALGNNSIVRNNQNNNLLKYELTNAKSISINQNTSEDNHLISKKHVEYLSGNSTVVRKTYDNNMPNQNFLSAKKFCIKDQLTQNEDGCYKEYVDSLVSENTIMRFSQTLENLLKVQVGDTI